MPAQVHGLGRRLLSDQAPMVMKGERRAVVDEPGLSPPEEDVRVRRCAVVVHHELVEEQNARSELVGKPAELLGAWVTGAVEPPETEVRPDAEAQQIGELVVLVVAWDVGWELDEHALGNGEPELFRDFRDDDLGYQRKHTLTRAAQLRHEAPAFGRDDDRR